MQPLPSCAARSSCCVGNYGIKTKETFFVKNFPFFGFPVAAFFVVRHVIDFGLCFLFKAIARKWTSLIIVHFAKKKKKLSFIFKTVYWRQEFSVKSEEENCIVPQADRYQDIRIHSTQCPKVVVSSLCYSFIKAGTMPLLGPLWPSGAKLCCCFPSCLNAI